ncbi:hypothetical protein PENTCL1PPCAC_13487, partial [Pristionchus entomophagus]
CSDAHCDSCRQMIDHWNNLRANCEACTPLKNATNQNVFAATPISAFVQQMQQQQPVNAAPAIVSCSVAVSVQLLAALDKITTAQEKTNELLAKIVAKLG